MQKKWETDKKEQRGKEDEADLVAQMVHKEPSILDPLKLIDPINIQIMQGAAPLYYLTLTLWLGSILIIILILPLFDHVPQELCVQKFLWKIWGNKNALLTIMGLYDSEQ